MKHTRGAMALAVAAIVVVLAAPASAHTKVLSTSPADGQTVHGGVTTISVRFDDVVTLVPHALVVTTDLGIPVQIESPHIVDGKALEAFVQDHLAPGRYAVAWRIQAADGHLVSSSFSFTVAGTSTSAAGRQATTATPPPAPGQPIWPVLVAAGIAAAAGLGAGLTVRRGLRIAAARNAPAVHVTQNPDEYLGPKTPKPPLQDA